MTRNERNQLMRMDAQLLRSQIQQYQGQSPLGFELKQHEIASLRHNEKLTLVLLDLRSSLRIHPHRVSIRAKGSSFDRFSN